jgi:hypothetical protein
MGENKSIPMRWMAIALVRQRHKEDNEVEGILKLLLPLVTSTKVTASCTGIDVK